MLAGIREVTLDSGHNQHRRAYLQVQGERPHLLSPLGHLGTLCRMNWCVGRNTPPQVGSPELSPVTILWRCLHHQTRRSVPVLFSLFTGSGRVSSVAVVDDWLPAVSSWSRSMMLTRSCPRGS
jgi:hypothetical protein